MAGNYSYGGSYGYNSYSARKRRSRADWAGSGISDAFNDGIEYRTRLTAQRRFYNRVHKIQKRVARLTGAVSASRLKPKVPPQLSPFYTGYPAMLAAPASIGVTAFLEFAARCRISPLAKELGKKYLENPALVTGLDVDPSMFKKVAAIVARWVEKRLLLEDLGRHNDLISIELYRLFAASQERLKFRTLTEIVLSVVLFGDIHPDWKELELHPITRDIISDLSDASAPYLSRLAQESGPGLTTIGADWVRAACLAIANYIPPPQKDGTADEAEEPDKERENFEDLARRIAGRGPRGRRHAERIMRRLGLPKKPQRMGRDQNPPDRPVVLEARLRHDRDRVAPLDAPVPPLLDDPDDLLANLAASMMIMEFLGDDQSRSEMHQALYNLAQALDNAGRQHNEWEDMRFDIMENLLQASPFATGPIEGDPVGGAEVTRKLDGKDITAEIFDRVVMPGDNPAAASRLLEEAEPITQALWRNFYPSIRHEPETQRFCSSGSIDPSRLAEAEYSETLYRRFPMLDVMDRRGSPVLLLACDGSASLSDQQMKMIKLLSTAWLGSATRMGVKILSAFYHSGDIRRGVGGPLIQWIHHPAKTPAANLEDAVGAVAALPNRGTGRQFDALSIAALLDEAKKLARGDMVFMILLSDTEWNRSWNTSQSGLREVKSVFEQAYADFGGKLNATLVALGKTRQTGLEDHLDEVILISDNELKDIKAVAGKISDHVSKCLRQRKKKRIVSA